MNAFSQFLNVSSAMSTVQHAGHLTQAAQTVKLWSLQFTLLQDCQDFQLNKCERVSSHKINAPNTGQFQGVFQEINNATDNHLNLEKLCQLPCTAISSLILQTITAHMSSTGGMKLVNVTKQFTCNVRVDCVPLSWVNVITHASSSCGIGTVYCQLGLWVCLSVCTLKGTRIQLSTPKSI